MTSLSSATSSSMISTYDSANMLRINGLATGLDTDTIVKQLMQAESAPLDSMKQQQQILEWQQDDYRTINTAIRSLRDASFNMTLQGTYLKYKSSVVDSGTLNTTSIITASPGATALEGNYTINVLQTAKAANLVSTQAVNIDPTKSLSSQGISSIDFTITSNQVDSSGNKTTLGTFNFSTSDTSNLTLNDIISKINNSNIGVKASYDTTLKRLVISSTGTGSNAQIDITDNNGTSFMENTMHLSTKTIKSTPTLASNPDYTNLNTMLGTSDITAQALTINIGGNLCNISFNPTDSIYDLMYKISNAKDANGNSLGLTASYSKDYNNIEISSTNGQDFSISSTSDIVAKLNIGANSTTNISTMGQDALYSYTNKQIGATVDDLTSHTNTNIIINGTNYTINGTGSADINIQKDTDTIYNAVKSFIDQYNNTIDAINKIYTEPKIKDSNGNYYLPLTDAQKQQLTETQQEQWTNNAKSGVLNGDDTLSSIMYGMRNVMSSNAKISGSSITNIYQIGLSTSSYFIDNTGKIQIDDSKLKDAINNNLDDVIKLFTNPVPANGDKSQSGIMLQLNDYLDSAVDNLTQKAGISGALVDNSIMGKEISDYSSRISDYTNRLKDIEDRYYNEFSRLEVAMNQMNAQSGWLSLMLSSGG